MILGENDVLVCRVLYQVLHIEPIIEKFGDYQLVGLHITNGCYCLERRGEGRRAISFQFIKTLLLTYLEAINAHYKRTLKCLFTDGGMFSGSYKIACFGECRSSI